MKSVLSLQFFKCFAGLSVVAMLCSCEEASDQGEMDSPKSGVVTHVMTKAEQAKLSPDSVIREFIEGNKRFNSSRSTPRDLSIQARKSAPGQYPKAVVLSCLDSRVPVEDVFDQGLGDIFVGRVAGNFVNEDLLGSMEFACKLAGAKVVLVLGHQHCGAIKGVIDHVELGNLTGLLNKLKPALALSQDFKGEKSAKNEDFVRYVSENNVRHTLQQIRLRSPILREMEKKGEIKIVGAFYRLTDGTMQILE